MKAETYYHYSHFKTPSRIAEKSLLVSDGMGYTADSDFRIDRKTFYNYLAFYVYKGTFYIEQYGKKLTLHAGTCGILNLMDPHLYYSDSEDTAHLLWFHFRGAGTELLIKNLSENDQLPYLSSSVNAEENFLKAFYLTEHAAGEPQLAGHLYGTIMDILKDFSFQNMEDRHLPAELRETTRFMDANLSIPLNLDLLSKNAGMGKYHFCHLFKQWYGISPIQYYNGRKMEMACQLLKTNNDSIDKIAEQLGYVNSDHFRKTFKKYFGITPSGYRKGKRQ